MDQQSTKFRADVEGLRAICVVAVVMYHAFVSIVPGGFVGVDVFFVISGYLITRLLITEYRQTGDIALSQFVGRRIRRILPAATLVLCCSALLSLVFPALDADDLSRHVRAAALFYHNIYQAHTAVDYLGLSAHQNPLLHYWSLAVEEQFYFVWPVLLLSLLHMSARMGAPQIQKRAILLIMGTLWLSSVGYSLYLINHHPTWAFFDPVARMYQLISGAILAVAEPGQRPVRSSEPERNVVALSRLRLALGPVALGVIVGCFFIISPRSSYPGWTALCPTIAAALLIHSTADHTTPLSQIMSNTVLRYVGRISFSWYLWHWPLLVFTRLMMGDLPTDQMTVALLVAILASLALAALTYQFVELPLCRGASFRTSLGRTFSLGAALITVGVGSGVAMQRFAPDWLPIGGGAYKSAAALKRDRPVIYADKCLRRFADVAHLDCRYGKTGGQRTVVLLGDSHAGNWFAPLTAAAIAEGWQVLVRIKASCRPVDAVQSLTDGGRDRVYTECADWLAATLAEIKTTKPDMIIVASAFHHLPMEAERRVLERLGSAAPTVVIADTPWYPQTTAACLRTHRDAIKCAWPLGSLLPAVNYPKTPKSDLPDGVRLLDLNARVCPDNLCRVIQDGQFVMFDEHHLSASFSQTFTGKFRQILQSAAER
jgi:peptidoglycan/LPS O-acetylase OafA/YrhL